MARKRDASRPLEKLDARIVLNEGGEMGETEEKHAIVNIAS